jgi:hypothetical protein
MRLVRGVPLLFIAVTLSAAPLGAQRRRSVEVVPGQMTVVVEDTMGTPYRVPLPRATVYRALLAVYDELKIPAEIRDSAAGRVGVPSFYRRGDFAGHQISTWLSCGESMTGPNADNYRVYMYLMSTVSPDGENAATLRSVLLAGAVNVTEGARHPMPCESTGRLEVRIQLLVLKKAVGI